MPFSTRNPAELEVNKIYSFTRDINGYSYYMKLRGTCTKHIWWQDCQYTGIRPGHPTSTVYEFDTMLPNGNKTAQWVWEKTYDEDNHRVIPQKSDGVWTEVTNLMTLDDLHARGFLA